MHACWMAMLLAVAAGPESRPAEMGFAVRLPEVKVGYPGVEYWAEIEGPGGGKLWVFAVYQGDDRWQVALPPGPAGEYRLVRVESRQGDKRAAVTVSPESTTRCTAVEARTPVKEEKRTLVEAGEFTTFYTAAEPWCVNDHTLVQGPDKVWHMFGITHPKPFDFFKDPGKALAHATADTLLQAPWKARPPAVTADWEKYKEYLFWAPHVIRHDGTYYMFVCSGDKETHNYRLALLTSPDLKEWTRHPANPLLVDGFDGRDPMVIRLKDRWAMYYTATSRPEGGNHTVACVTSKDLVHWSDRKVVFVHPNAGTFGGPTESPFVVQRGRQFYLFLCDNDWTDVYLSDDPFHWDIERKAGRIRSHASEVVRDADGKWYVSHAGWMNGPLKIAPLVWKDGLEDPPAEK